MIESKYIHVKMTMENISSIVKFAFGKNIWYNN